MTTDSNKLLERLRTYYGDDLPCRELLMDARHAIEALEGEVEAYESARVTWAESMRAWINRATVAERERDRLKAALDEAVKWMDGCAVSGGYPTWHAKARKALGGDA